MVIRIHNFTKFYTNRRWLEITSIYYVAGFLLKNEDSKTPNIAFVDASSSFSEVTFRDLRTKQYLNKSSTESSSQNKSSQNKSKNGQIDSIGKQICVIGRPSCDKVNVYSRPWKIWEYGELLQDNFLVKPPVQTVGTIYELQTNGISLIPGDIFTDSNVLVNYSELMNVKDSVFAFHNNFPGSYRVFFLKCRVWGKIKSFGVFFGSKRDF